MVAKSRFVVVLLQSVVSGHRAFLLRERAGEKLERILFDPELGRMCLYKEVKKIKGVNKVPTPVQKALGLI